MKPLLKLLALLILITLFTSCERQDVHEDAPPKLVKVVTVSDEKKTPQYTYPGRVRANKEVLLAFEVSGRIIELFIEEGQDVVKNELLTRLDPRDFQVEVDKAKARYQKAVIDVERNRPLAEQEFVSKMIFDELIAKKDIAEADLKGAEKSLEDSYLRAPFAGIIARRLVDNFQNIKAKEPVIELHKIDNIEVALNIPSKDIVFADKEADEISVEFDDYQGVHFLANLKSFSIQADPKTSTYAVSLVLPQPEGVNILPGMAATVTVTDFIEAEEFRRSYYTIPVSAIDSDPSGKPYAWVVDPSRASVHQVYVKLGLLMDDEVQVVEGLKAGDVVVVAGASYLTEDTEVRIMAAKEGAK